MAKGVKCVQHGQTAQGRCRECQRRGRKRYMSTPNGRATYNRGMKGVMFRQTLRRHGLVPEEYAKLLNEQGGVCAICRRTQHGKRLAIDHDHLSGRVRGLLCQHCNLALGQFQDDPLRLQAAIEYLK